MPSGNQGPGVPGSGPGPNVPIPRDQSYGQPPLHPTQQPPHMQSQQIIPPHQQQQSQHQQPLHNQQAQQGPPQPPHRPQHQQSHTPQHPVQIQQQPPQIQQRPPHSHNPQQPHRVHIQPAHAAQKLQPQQSNPKQQQHPPPSQQQQQGKGVTNAEHPNVGDKSSASVTSSSLSLSRGADRGPGGPTERMITPHQPQQPPHTQKGRPPGNHPYNQPQQQQPPMAQQPIMVKGSMQPQQQQQQPPTHVQHQQQQQQKRPPQQQQPGGQQNTGTHPQPPIHPQHPQQQTKKAQQNQHQQQQHPHKQPLTQQQPPGPPPQPQTLAPMPPSVAQQGPQLTAIAPNPASNTNNNNSNSNSGITGPNPGANYSGASAGTGTNTNAIASANAVATPQEGGGTPTSSLKVEDALLYLDDVKLQFKDDPQVYNQFLDIMKEFKSQAIDTPGVINRVSTLFQGRPKLIRGFNTFLPPGYQIEIGVNGQPLMRQMQDGRAVYMPVGPMVNGPPLAAHQGMGIMGPGQAPIAMRGPMGDADNKRDNQRSGMGSGGPTTGGHESKPIAIAPGGGPKKAIRRSGTGPGPDQSGPPHANIAPQQHPHHNPQQNPKNIAMAPGNKGQGVGGNKPLQPQHGSPRMPNQQQQQPLAIQKGSNGPPLQPQPSQAQGQPPHHMPYGQNGPNGPGPGAGQGQGSKQGPNMPGGQQQQQRSQQPPPPPQHAGRPPMPMSGSGPLTGPERRESAYAGGQSPHYSGQPQQHSQAPGYPHPHPQQPQQQQTPHQQAPRNTQAQGPVPVQNGPAGGPPPGNPPIKPNTEQNGPKHVMKGPTQPQTPVQPHDNAPAGNANAAAGSNPRRPPLAKGPPGQSQQPPAQTTPPHQPPQQGRPIAYRDQKMGMGPHPNSLSAGSGAAGAGGPTPQSIQPQPPSQQPHVPPPLPNEPAQSQNTPQQQRSGSTSEQSQPPQHAPSHGPGGQRGPSGRQSLPQYQQLPGEQGGVKYEGQGGKYESQPPTQVQGSLQAKPQVQIEPHPQQAQQQQGMQGPAGIGPSVPPARPPVEFNHAINYVNKIKTRFAGSPEIYKNFLEILHTYQKEQQTIKEVYSQVAHLFRSNLDLLEEFSQFLPEAAPYAESVARGGQGPLPPPLPTTNGPYHNTLNIPEERIMYENAPHIRDGGMHGPEDMDMDVQYSNRENMARENRERERHDRERELEREHERERERERERDRDTRDHGPGGKTGRDVGPRHELVKERPVGPSTGMHTGTGSVRGRGGKGAGKGGVGRGGKANGKRKTARQEIFDPGYSSVAPLPQQQTTWSAVAPAPIGLGPVAGGRGPNGEGLSGETGAQDSPQPVKRKKALSSELKIPECSTYNTLVFFTKVKAALKNQKAMDNFIRATKLYENGTVNETELVSMVEPFLTASPELLEWFKSYLPNVAANQNGTSAGGDGVGGSEVAALPNGTSSSLVKTMADDKMADFLEPIPLPNDKNPNCLTNIWDLENDKSATGIIDFTACKRYGYSYRALPKSHLGRKCSGRTPADQSVLNDIWVSSATSSEDSYFVNSRKNTHEEQLALCEEARYEMSTLLGELTDTIRVLEYTAKKLAGMSQTEAAAMRLDEKLGGSSRTIYKKALKRIYDEKTPEIIDGLRTNTAVAVPIVLKRLKQKCEELRTAKIGWDQVWDATTEKNHAKSLDHQGPTFKQNDRKAISVKAMLAEVEAKRNEESAQASAKEVPHYTHNYEDREVLQEVARLMHHYLFNCPNSFSNSDRQKMSHLLCNFLCKLIGTEPMDSDKLTHPPHIERSVSPAASTTNAAAKARASKATSTAPNKDTALVPGVKSSSPTKLDRESGNEPQLESGIDPTRENGVMYMGRKLESDRQGRYRGPQPTIIDPLNKVLAISSSKTSGKSKKRVPRTIDMFYGNNHWFAFLRMHYLIYSRCKGLKRWAKYKEQHEYDGFTKQDPHDEVAVIIKRKLAPSVEPAHYHKTFITYVEALLDNGIDSTTYEDLCRDLYGPRAHEVFTIDRLIQNSMRQLHSLTTDETSRKLLSLYDYNQLCKETYPSFNPAVYRTNCEHAIRDESLFSVEFRKFGPLSEKISDARVRMLATDDSSPRVDASTVDEEWSLYVSKYIDDTTIAPPSAVPSIRRIPIDSTRSARKRPRVEADTDMDVKACEKSTTDAGTGTDTTTGGGEQADTGERIAKAARIESDKGTDDDANKDEAAEVGGKDGGVKTEPRTGKDGACTSTKPPEQDTSVAKEKGAAGADPSISTSTGVDSKETVTTDDAAETAQPKDSPRVNHRMATPVVMVTSEPVGITPQYVLSHIYHTQERSTASTAGNPKGRGKVGRGGAASGHHGNGRRSYRDKDANNGDSDAGSTSHGNSRINSGGRQNNENEAAHQSNLLVGYTGSMLKVPVFLRRSVDTSVEKHVHSHAVATADAAEPAGVVETVDAIDTGGECTAEYRDGTDKVSVYAKNALEVKMCINSYKLKYVTDTSDYMMKTRTSGLMIAKSRNAPSTNLKRWRRLGTEWLDNNKSTEKATETLLSLIKGTSQEVTVEKTDTGGPDLSGS